MSQPYKRIKGEGRRISTVAYAKAAVAEGWVERMALYAARRAARNAGVRRSLAKRGCP